MQSLAKTSAIGIRTQDYGVETGDNRYLEHVMQTTRTWTLRGLASLSSLAIVLGCAGCSEGPVTPSEQVPQPHSTLDKEADANTPAASNDSSASSSPGEQGDLSKPTQPASTVAPMMKMAVPAASDIVFKDDVVSNVAVPTGLDGLVFQDTSGKRVQLSTYLGKRHVVLVFTEGFAGGMLCPFCKTQTSRLVANYKKFQELETEILVVYPGSRDHLDEFILAATKTDKQQVDQVPFPLVLDEDLSAVGYFNIASNLAHPSTFIIDKAGSVRLAYVGADMSADRPSVAAMLEVLKAASTP